ncbi:MULTISPECIES: adenosylcobinamide-GDP ribazoletransferase [unclassified Archaeoglobus]|jgi:adenosylcobinamide-GDP ribazoletransferase|uniref:adenosylcobinamide-GDP ribazoletransferase n=1 Tax=unclassified Archaeoglobus TaxID=2643606 RepID=UPI0025BB336E|nr:MULTISPECIES: adenosylcobinamide-GDP ribazoletransferase [unclassified Archaeoglobus]
MLGSSIAFLTTIPIKGDIEKLRRNLWTFTYTAVVIGLIIAIPDFVRQYAGFDIRFLAVALYMAVEGINHIDGLIDFGDAFFAPESRKKEALKDTNTGAGGIATAILYLVLLYHTLQLSNAIQIIFAQIAAKFSMLLLMVTSKPSWEGMASYMMEFAGFKDVFIALPPLIVAGYLIGLNSVYAIAMTIVVVLILKGYSEKKFGGINGDIIGSANCITFLSSLLTL